MLVPRDVHRHRFVLSHLVACFLGVLASGFVPGGTMDRGPAIGGLLVVRGGPSTHLDALFSNEPGRPIPRLGGVEEKTMAMMVTMADRAYRENSRPRSSTNTGDRIERQTSRAVPEFQ
jgi:hypothetical protein